MRFRELTRKLLIAVWLLLWVAAIPAATVFAQTTPAVVGSTQAMEALPTTVNFAIRTAYYPDQPFAGAPDYYQQVACSGTCLAADGGSIFLSNSGTTYWQLIPQSTYDPRTGGTRPDTQTAYQNTVAVSGTGTTLFHFRVAIVIPLRTICRRKNI
jgi:hypothetical protein